MFNKKSAGALTALILIVSASAANHSALNGTWKLLPDRCDFSGQRVVQSGSVTIADREGNITISRNFVYEGAGETVFYSDVTDGQKNATIHTGSDMKSKTSWDHEVLKVKTTQFGTVTLESYTLQADGSLTASVVRPEGKPVTLVFERK